MKFDVIFEQNDMSFDPDFQMGTGVVGATFFPSISDDGFLSWTNDGNFPNPKPVNIKGISGEKGEQGDPGKPGADGHTPKRGTDYWTEADRQQMVNDVIAALPVYNGEVIK